MDGLTLTPENKAARQSRSAVDLRERVEQLSAQLVREAPPPRGRHRPLTA